jgi:hypothetical protein
MAGVTSYIGLVIYPIVYIFLAMASLGQLCMLFTLLSSTSYHLERSQLLEPFAPSACVVRAQLVACVGVVCAAAAELAVSGSHPGSYC